MSRARQSDQRQLSDLLGDPLYVAARAAELTRAPISAAAEPIDPVGILRGIAAITGEPFDGLKSDFDKGGALARALSKLFQLQKRGRGNPRADRSTEYWEVVSILKAGGFKGSALREAIKQTVGCHENQVATWLTGYRRARKGRSEIALLSALFVSPETDLGTRALHIALRI